MQVRIPGTAQGKSFPRALAQAPGAELVPSSKSQGHNADFHGEPKIRASWIQAIPQAAPGIRWERWYSQQAHRLHARPLQSSRSNQHSETERNLFCHSIAHTEL